MRNDLDLDLNSTFAMFEKEIQFYSTIVPAIEHFEEMENVPQIERINDFARYYGSRLSLNPSKTFKIIEIKNYQY